jgi:hypothetical protein
MCHCERGGVANEKLQLLLDYGVRRRRGCRCTRSAQGDKYAHDLHRQHGTNHQSQLLARPTVSKLGSSRRALDRFDPLEPPS